MGVRGLNHVSVSAPDLDASFAFYSEVFGAAEAPTPNFGFGVRWLQVGEEQLHLFQRPENAPRYHHFAFSVDDLGPVFDAACKRDCFDRETFGHHLIELPGDCVQLYLRDPGGNLVEVDCLGGVASA